jgi:MoxR-like ATPase
MAVEDRDLALLDRVAEVATSLRREVEKRIVGQHEIVEGLLTALLANGHALLVGVPGLAKTLLVSTVAEALDLEFSRIQFTPDLMPTDITGTEVIEEDRTTGRREFRFVKGPVFANIVLADEINRTPPKTRRVIPTPWTHPSSCSPRRTPSSRRERTLCPRRSWTGSCWSFRSGTPPGRRRKRSP